MGFSSSVSPKLLTTPRILVIFMYLKLFCEELLYSFKLLREHVMRKNTVLGDFCPIPGSPRMLTSSEFKHTWYMYVTS